MHSHRRSHSRWSNSPKFGRNFLSAVVIAPAKKQTHVRNEPAHCGMRARRYHGAVGAGNAAGDYELWPHFTAASAQPRAVRVRTK